MMEQKKITFTQLGKGWTAKFEGMITRKDIIKLQRVITVEYAKSERLRTVARLTRSHNDTPTKPLEITNAIRRSE